MGRFVRFILAAAAAGVLTGLPSLAAQQAAKSSAAINRPAGGLSPVRLAPSGASVLTLTDLGKRRSSEIHDSDLVQISLSVASVQTLARKDPGILKDPLVRKLASARTASGPAAAKPRTLSVEDVKNARPGDLRASDIVRLTLTVSTLKDLAAKRHEALKAPDARPETARSGDLQSWKREQAQSEKSRIADIAARIDALRPPETATDEPGYGVSCDPPKITSVYPMEVRPGDPLLITGCGFYGDVGTAAILVDGQERILTIKKWAGQTLEATIPGFGGFAANKQVTVVVRNAQGHQSAPSQPMTLVPNMRRDTLYAVPYQKCSVGSSACSLDDGGYMPSTGSFSCYGVHTGTICCWPCECNGTDRFFEGMQLKNNWRVVSIGINAVFDLLGAWEEPCRQGSEARALLTVENPKAGDSYINRVSVYWYTASGYTVSYKVWVTIQGPDGTSPY